MLWTHRSFEAYCATPWWRWLVFFFSFFRVMEHRWNEVDKEKPKYSGKKTCPSAILSTTNPTWTDPGPKPGLSGGRPATNRLSNGTAYLHLLPKSPVRQQERESTDVSAVHFCGSLVASNLTIWPTFWFVLNYLHDSKLFHKLNSYNGLQWFYIVEHSPTEQVSATKNL
jgi:hypothetical protein